MFQKLYFKGLFKLNFEAVCNQIYYKKLSDVTFFYAGKIEFDPISKSKLGGSMLGKRKSNLLISKLNSEELWISWRHPILKDHVSLHLFRNDEKWMEGEIEGKKIGKSITICQLPRSSMMKFLEELYAAEQ